MDLVNICKSRSKASSGFHNSCQERVFFALLTETEMQLPGELERLMRRNQHGRRACLRQEAFGAFPSAGRALSSLSAQL